MATRFKSVIAFLTLALAMGCVAPEPFVARQLDVRIDPKDAATFMLNPSPLGKGGYSQGMVVTIDILPKQGWQVDKWVGPVFNIDGTAAQIQMDSSQAVAVRLKSTSPGAIPSPVAVMASATSGVVATSVPTATPDASSFYDEGRDYYNSGHYLKAENAFSRLIFFDPDYPGAYWWRGLARHNRTQYHDAIKDYDKAIQLDPSHSLAYDERGYNSSVRRTAWGTPPDFAEGECRKAIQRYEKAIQLDSNNANAYYNRGLTYLDMGEYVEAKADMAKACSLFILYC